MNPAAKPEELTNAAEQKAASESAAAVASELKGIQIPSGLKDQQADLERALKITQLLIKQKQTN